MIGKILTVGLSPAWQHVLVFDRLDRGDVNRAHESHSLASGKVLNAARAVARLNAPGCALTISGGALGAALRGALDDEAIEHDGVVTKSASRTCTTVVEKSRGSITELVENMPPISGDELAEFRETFHQQARSASAAVLLGSLPEGTPTTYFRELVEGARFPVIVDLRGPELVETLHTRPTLVKPNRLELERTLETSLSSDTDLLRAMRGVNDRGAEWVLVTQGAGAVFATHAGEVHRFDPPTGEVVNPIGCGDTLAGGIAVGLTENRSMIEAIRLGIGCAVANLRTLLQGDIRRDDALRFAAEVQCTRVG